MLVTRKKLGETKLMVGNNQPLLIGIGLSENLGKSAALPALPYGIHIFVRANVWVWKNMCDIRAGAHFL